MHGTVLSADLANELQRMDAFLICYDVQKDQSMVTNYKKVVEFISIGKVTIANNISTDNNKNSMVILTESRSSDKELPALFTKVLNALQKHIDVNLQAFRIFFAKENTYQKQLEKIETVVSALYPLLQNYSLK